MAADFLSRHICQNATHGAMELFFTRDIFERKQKKTSLVRLGRQLRAAVTHRRAESRLLLGCGTQAVICSDQPRNFLLAGAEASSCFRRVKRREKGHASA